MLICSTAVKEQSSGHSERSRRFTANSSGTEVHTALPWQRSGDFCCVAMVEFSWSAVQRLHCLKRAAWKSLCLSSSPSRRCQLNLSCRFIVGQVHSRSLTAINCKIYVAYPWRFQTHCMFRRLSEIMGAVCCLLWQQIEIMSLWTLWGCGPLWK